MKFASYGMSNAEASFAFDRSFGKAGIAEEQMYYGGIQTGKKESDDSLRSIGKALMGSMIQKGPSIGNTTGGTHTSYGLMPSFVDPSLVDRTVRLTPLVRLLPRRAVRGRSYVYNAVTVKGGAGFKDDDASLADDVDTRTVTSTQLKYLYAVGRVTGPALASGSGYINLLSEDLRVKTASMNEALENEIINGAVATDANGFDGLRTAISTNSTSNAGASLTLAQVRDDFNTSFQANGLIDLVVMDGATFNKFKGLLMDFQRNVESPTGRLDFGISDAFTFDGALFIKDRYMPTTAASRETLFLDTRYVFLAVLQDITFEELAKNNDSSKYMLKWYGALIVTFEAAMVKRTSLE